MDFRLDDDQRQLRDALRRFCDEEVAPHAAQRDAEERFEPGLVETSAGVIGLAISLAGIVEHDDLDGYIRLRFEAVAGKVIVEVGLGEAVTDRVRSGGKEFAHPIQARGSTGRK